MDTEERTQWRLLMSETNLENFFIGGSFCTNYQLMRQAYDDIQKNGITKPIYKTTISPVTGDVVAKDFTGFKRNPSTQILDSATAKLRSLGNELGLTPQSRAELMNIRLDDDNDGAMESLKEFFGKS